MEVTKSTRIKTSYQFNHGDTVMELTHKLPYRLTQDQISALTDINRDLSGTVPMQRLLQGDVGSGKTILAFFAMLNAHFSGYQSAIMAPTEVLAKQHYETFSSYSKLFNISFDLYLLTGSLSAKEIGLKKA